MAAATGPPGSAVVVAVIGWGVAGEGEVWVNALCREINKPPAAKHTDTNPKHDKIQDSPTSTCRRCVLPAATYASAGTLPTCSATSSSRRCRRRCCCCCCCCSRLAAASPSAAAPCSRLASRGATARTSNTEQSTSSVIPSSSPLPPAPPPRAPVRCADSNACAPPWTPPVRSQWCPGAAAPAAAAAAVLVGCWLLLMVNSATSQLGSPPPAPSPSGSDSL